MDKKLIATLRRLATKERKNYEKACNEGCHSLEYLGTCKGMWLAYEDSAKRLEKALNG